MLVEECCHALLAEMLPFVDEQRKGVCIEVGIGTFAFYCELFARAGYKTVAVEPIPVRALSRLCRQLGITLVRACLADTDAARSLYLGVFHGKDNVNLSSLEPDWWGVSTRSCRVPAMTLQTLLSHIGIQQITCLKLDVEGYELTILQQLVKLSTALLPNIVVFEYGGGGPRVSGAGGWSPKYLAATMECLKVLRHCRYRYSVLIDSSEFAEARIINLSDTLLDHETLFYSHAVHGNIISLLGARFPQRSVHEICSRFSQQKLHGPQESRWHVLRTAKRLVGSFLA